MFFFSKNVNANDKRTLHEFSFNDVDGKKYLLSQHKNKVVLLVNVASQCGFTKQYTDLQALWDKYKSKNFVIIGVPSIGSIIQARSVLSTDVPNSSPIIASPLRCLPK